MRLTAAMVTIVLVFVLTYLAAWVAMREHVGMPSAGGQQTMMFNDFHQIAAAIEVFHRDVGRNPDSLDELARIAQGRDLFDATRRLRFHDAWGNPYRYERTDAGYRLYSVGRDGESGGQGLDADIDYNPESRPVVAPTLHQFLFEAPGSGTLFSVAGVAGLCTGFACFLATSRRKGDRVSRREAVAYSAALTAAAVCVSLVLVFVYVFGEHH